MTNENNESLIVEDLNIHLNIYCHAQLEVVMVSVPAINASFCQVWNGLDADAPTASPGD